MASGPLTSASGEALVQAMNTGGFAERVVVDQSQVVKLSDGIAMEVASLLACGVITGVGAVVNAAGLRPGQDVVVIGAGGVGLNAIQGARIAGARRIIAVDMSEEKLAIAREFGATDGVLATEEKPWRAAKKAMGRGADAVFVTVGAIPAYDKAPQYLANGGKVIMVGMPHSGAMSTYEPVMLAATGQGMVGSKMGDVVIARDIPWMVDLYEQGRLKLDELISGRWSLEQINEAIADTKTGSAKRNVIVFD
jgi:S-(hydroxymethyl)glutathione dehydrogenase/alcohol dehydrogenase